MKSAPDELVYGVRAVEVAGVDMIDAEGERFAEDCDGCVGVGRRTPDAWALKVSR
jgi:hypothetical protein